jgi:HEAT repeat protein
MDVIREAAVRAVAGLRDEPSSPTLAALLQTDASAVVRLACVQALALLQAIDIGRPVLVGALRDSVPAVRREAAGALSSLNAPVAQELLAALTSERDPTVCQALTYALGRVPRSQPQVPQIENALDAEARSESPLVREAAIWSLGSLNSSRARDRVRSALRDPTESVKVAAIQSAGRQRDSQAVPVLISLLSTSMASVRAAVMDALGLIGDRRAISPLIGYLKDDNEFVRTAASRALNRLQAADELERAFNDASPLVRLHAIEAFAPATNLPVPGLIRALGDADYDVRTAAIRALSSVSDQDDMNLIIQALSDADARRQQSALVVIGNVGRKVTPSNTVLLDNAIDELLRRPPTSATRAEAVRTAGKLQRASWIDAILSASTADDSAVRTAAAEALGQYTDARAIQTLQKLIQDPVVDVQRAVADSLRRLNVK